MPVALTILSSTFSILIKLLYVKYYIVPGLFGDSPAKGKYKFKNVISKPGNIKPSSGEYSTIDLLDPPAVVKDKFKKVFCKPGNITENGPLAFAKHVIFGLFQPGESKN